MKRPNIITRAALRGKPLFDFCKKAKTTNHECGKDDNRIEPDESVYNSIRCVEKELNRTKRALWLARAELCRSLDVDRYLRKHSNSWYNENCLTWNEACVAMKVKICNAESKCRAYADKFMEVE